MMATNKLKKVVMSLSFTKMIDDNGRLCPGKKECVLLGHKVYKQKRLNIVFFEWVIC